MALSTRARIAGIGGALAIGLLGAGGVAYAAGGDGSDGGTASYVTVVDDGTTTAPATPGSREDCPGGSGSGTESGTATDPGDA